MWGVPLHQGPWAAGAGNPHHPRLHVFVEAEPIRRHPPRGRAAWGAPFFLMEGRCAPLAASAEPRSLDSAASDVEPEVDHVAVADQVVPPFEALLALLA